MAERDKAGENPRFHNMIKKWRLGDFFRQLLIVMAGILITFQGSAWIDRARDRRESREILALVVEELRQNLEEIHRCERQVKREIEAMEFFARYANNIRSAPGDSLEMHFSALGYFTEFNNNADALEVLKSSPSSIKVVDKELLRNIFYSYNMTGAAFNDFNVYFSMKYDIINDFVFHNDRHFLEQVIKDNDQFMYVEKYMDSPPGNFVLNASSTLTPKVKYISHIPNTIDNTISASEKYIDKK